MRRVICILASIGVVGLAAQAGAFGSNVVSRSANVVVDENVNSVVLLVVPENRSYLMTQACVYYDAATVVGSQLGDVVLDGYCTAYKPGIAFAPGETISCTSKVLGYSPFDSTTCLITGVLKRQPRHRGHDD